MEEQKENKPQSLYDWVADPEQRVEAKKKAEMLSGVLFRRMGAPDDPKKKKDTIFRISDLVRNTTLTHRTAREFLRTLSVFGYVEIVDNNHFKFFLDVSDQVEFICHDFYNSLIAPGVHLGRLMALINDPDSGYADKEKLKNDLRESIQDMLLYGLSDEVEKEMQEASKEE